MDKQTPKYRAGSADTARDAPLSAVFPCALYLQVGGSGILRSFYAKAVSFNSEEKRMHLFCLICLFAGLLASLQRSSGGGCISFLRPFRPF